MKQGRFRSTMVLIAKPGRNEWYRRLADLPASLRRDLDRATHGPAAGYIIIADRKGRERLGRRGDLPNFS
jgi:hypothetical protein